MLVRQAARLRPALPPREVRDAEFPARPGAFFPLDLAEVVLALDRAPVFFALDREPPVAWPRLLLALRLRLLLSLRFRPPCELVRRLVPELRLLRAAVPRLASPCRF
jgi:hypothetical protein